MEVFKGNKREDRKGTSAFDFKNGNKHLLLCLGDNGFLQMGLYYEDCERQFDFAENFSFDKSNHYVYDNLDRVFFSYGGRVFFATEGAGVILVKDDDAYRLEFDRTFEEKNGMIDASFESDTMENRSLMDFFQRLQSYDPECHQVHFDEVIYEKKLKSVETL